MSSHDDRRGGQLDRLNPDIARRLPQVPDYRPGSVHVARALMADAMGESLPEPSEITWAESSSGRVEIRIHRPAGQPSGGALLFIHGGGFVMGSAALYDGVSSELAALTGCTVLTVDYRLAPEHPFPAGLDDCEVAWRHIVSQCDDLGIDRARMGVYGESAGAALAIGLAHRLSFSPAELPALIVLQEPVTDDRLDHKSSRIFTDTPVWNRALADWSWDLYLGVHRSSPPKESAPARILDFKGFPRTFISTRDLDPLRDEGMAFARRLIDDGVAVDLRHYAGTIHGTLGFTGVRVRERILRDAAEFVIEHLAEAPK